MTRSLDLGGDEWRFRQVGTSQWLPAQVPGCVHTDLLAAGRIPDPLVGTNELDVLWIDEADWEYERPFDVDEDLLTRQGLWLVCDGLDSVAEITLNDAPVGQTFNMFRRYRFDVRPHLRKGTNYLRITFRSPIHYGRQQSEKLPYELPGTTYEWGGTERKRRVYRPYVRKAQYQFGWDWGPCLATSGVWRGIRLVASNAPQIECVTTRQHHVAGRVRVDVSAHLLSPAASEGRLRVSVGGIEVTNAAQIPAGESLASGSVEIDSPRLWWPRGYGEQPLYPVVVEWLTTNGTVAARHETQIGLRTVELVREPDEAGESFFLRVNGRDVYCKGANWIPADPFPPRATAERYERLIQAAVDANMNMLRVWGGGIYEDPLFYDLCDRHGLLVWQDFMFACAAYPADPDFLAEVAAEARHQTRRLTNHPSIALWCGDNEDEWAVASWWHQADGDPDLRPDYDRLIHDTIAPIVAEEDPQRPWWPSSPSSLGQGHPNDTNRGDAHYWDVWHQGTTFDLYRRVVPRFCSEFGFQSFPSIRTLRTAVRTGATDVDDPELLHHQRNARGNEIIRQAVAREFREPADLDDFCYLSQLTQGLALQTALEHWRRQRPRCMGTLYWQLHDCWVVASWSTVDYELRYKAAHYIVRRCYAPLAGSLVIEEDRVQAWAASDLLHPVDGTLVLEAWTVDGKRQARIERPVRMPEQGSQRLDEFELGSLFDASTPAEDCLLRLVLTYNNQQHESVEPLVPYGQLRLSVPRIKCVFDRDADGVRVDLTTDRPALFVELDCGDVEGRFDDNCLHLFPGETWSVRFIGTKHVDWDLESLLRVCSLAER